MAEKQLRIRRAHRGQSSKLVKQMEDAIANKNSTQCAFVLSNLKKKLHTLEEIDSKLIDMLDPEAEGFENTIIECDDFINELNAKIHELELGHKSFLAETADEVRKHGSDTTKVVHNADEMKVKLPKTDLPKFNGDVLKWQTFWEIFDSAINSNTKLRNIDKFTYLKTSLIGEASACIDGLPLTSDNYPQALALLKSRFGKTHRIVDAYMKRLIELPRPSLEFHSIRKFLDYLESTVRTLQSLGKPENSYETMLLPMLWDKLPSELKRNMARAHGNKEWKLEEFRNELAAEVAVLESCNPSQEYTCTEESYHESTEDPFSTGTITSLITSASKQSTRACAFCTGKHFPSDCTSLKDVKSRVDFIKKNELCFNCLGKHRVINCRSLKRCLICKAKHHTSIHPTTDSDTTTSERENTSNASDTLVATMSTHSPAQVFLKTAITTVYDDRCAVNTTGHLLFDDGSQRTFITESLAKQLELHPKKRETLHISTFGSECAKSRELDEVEINIACDNSIQTVKALVVPKITQPVSVTLDSQVDIPELRGLKLAHPLDYNRNSFEVSLLIGSDYYYSFVESDFIKTAAGPVAVNSKLGYLICGPINKKSNDSYLTTMLNVLTQPEDSELKRFWDLETLGIEACDNVKDKNDFTEQYCKNNIRMVDGRYEAKLPWLNDHGELPSNLEIANYRTRSMVRRLAKTPELFKTYDNIIQDQLNQGFIELVPKSEMATSNKVHYLPHHPVLKDSTTTPIRIVFDCSCAQGDLPSLNDCLECGPPLINDLASLLLRFRVGKYAVTADIEKAFLNVGLDSSDRDTTRFFWPADPSNPESDFTVFRFKRVLFGAKCSPFILNSTIIHHLSEVRDTHEVAEIMQQNIYVDNILTSFQQATDVVNFYKESCSIMSNANFNLRSWATNCPDLELPEPNQCSFIKVLGLSWNVEKDILMLKTFNDSYMSNESPITKRSILQHIAKIFDPIGVLTPVTIRARILLQNLWKESFDWDTHLPEPFSSQWKEVVSDLKDIIQLEIPRQYSCLLDFTPKNSDCTILHVFADASSSAYGTVCYLQTPRNISFVIAKSRVAPVKSLTIPQLELMAATLAARLGSRAFDALKTVIPTLQIQFWSDSTITLGWISSNKTLPPFISNRVNEIHKLSKDSTWMYCPSELNPADILTRGTTAQQLRNNTMWLYGPEWLKDNKRPFEVCMSLPVNTLDNSNPPIMNDLEFGIHNIIDFDRYSDLTKLLRVTAWALRFINNTRKNTNSGTGPLQVSDLETAKRVLIQNTQNKAYPDVIHSLRNTNSTHRHSIIDQLQLFMDSKDIIRCRGRLHNAPLEDNAKYPILLPKKHAFTRLIVLEVHKKVLHSGVNSTLTSLRSAFWIPQARQLVRSLLKHCVVCRRLTCRPYRAPNPPPLPHSRVSEVPPFYYTGVDFCGPLLVRAAKIKKKCYICLFTCAVTRAVHLELTHDLTTDSFISALRRFASRRSLPRKIISDNASTFIGANASLRDLFLSNELHEKLCLRGVQWEFITKRAPWQGGFYERLIGITKLTLKKVLYRALVDFEELRTIITEIEACINNRPLVYVSEDIADGEALTPSHFLTGQVTTLPHPPVFDDELDDPQYDIHSNDLEKRARHRAVLFQKFKNRWAHEYLTSLREFHKFPGVNQETVKTGSVVLIKEDNIKRLNWKYGMITAIHRGSDGHIRTVSVKTKTGNTNRPISKLYPLEVHSNFTEPMSSDTTPQTQSCPDQDNLNLHHTDSRPRRNAAIRAQKRIQSWLSSD